MGKRRKRIAAVIVLAFASAGLAFVAVWSAPPDPAGAAATARDDDPRQSTGESSGEDYVPIAGEITAGDARLSFQGALEFLRDLKGLDLDFVFEGSDPEELGHALGIALKNTPPYRVEGHLRREEVWRFKGLSAMIGESRFEGTASVDLSGQRPLVRADIRSPKAYWRDVDSLFLDLKEKNPRPKADRHNYLSVDRFDPTLMRRLDAKVDFRGDWVRFRGAILQNVAVHVELRRRVLSYDASGFPIAGGKVRSRGRVDIRREGATSSFRATINRVNAGKLLKRLNIPNIQPGTLGGHFELSGKGRSIAEFFNTLNGELSVILAGGSIETIRVDVLERDLFELLSALGAGEAGGPISCAIGAFQARNGVVTVSTLLIEIPDAIITGAGTIDFHTETVDLTLTPHPKDPGWWSLAGIAHVTGSFRNPEVSVDLFEDIGAAAETVDPGPLDQPLARLLDYIDPAGPSASDCRRLVKRAAQANVQRQGD